MLWLHMEMDYQILKKNRINLRKEMKIKKNIRFFPYFNFSEDIFDLLSKNESYYVILVFIKKWFKKS